MGPRLHVLERYNGAIDVAIQRADFDTAELFLHKLLQMDEGRADVRYRLALLSEQRGETARAAEMMARLAPDSSEGHAGAHFWRAKQMLANRPQMTTQEADRLVHHLESSLRDTADNEEAQSLLGQLLFTQRKFDRAITHLSAIIENQPQWRIVLAKTYLAQGSRSSATRELGIVVDHFQKVLDSNPDDTDARLLVSEAWALQGKLDRAAKYLEEGFVTSGATRCRQALAAIYVLRFDTHKVTSDSDEIERLSFLEKALELAPNYPDALMRMTAYLQHQGPPGQIARAAIEDSFASGSAPASLHLVIGTNAASAGNVELAKMHLEQARRLEPQGAIVLNNLAYVVAQLDPPQLDYALDLANEAVEQAPYNGNIRETRGQILMRMERWSAALADFELALGSLKGNAKLHQNVAEIYDRLGNKPLADRHRKLADDAAHEAAKAKPTP
jgi:tetratricopeptide (TPR) repeat protein